MPRDEFPDRIKRTLSERVATLCSNPSCRVRTIGPSKSDSTKSTRIGVAAHIRAASPGGPRFDAKQDRETRQSIDNAIWLCENCADLIDSNGGIDHDVNTITTWKRQSERAALENLGSPEKLLFKWKHGLANLSYVNVPRLAMLAGLNSMPPSVSLLNDTSALHDLGFGLVRLMVEFEAVIDALHVDAVDLRKLGRMHEGIEGLTIAFEERFFTKNGPDHPSVKSTRPPVSSDWQTSPHVYSKLLAQWRLVLPVDPRWITTTTAFSQFRTGQVRFKGIAMIKQVSREERAVLASPYFLGLPRPEFEW